MEVIGRRLGKLSLILPPKFLTFLPKGAKKGIAKIIQEVSITFRLSLNQKEPQPKPIPGPSPLKF